MKQNDVTHPVLTAVLNCKHPLSTVSLLPSVVCTSQIICFSCHTLVFQKCAHRGFQTLPFHSKLIPSVNNGWQLKIHHPSQLLVVYSHTPYACVSCLQIDNVEQVQCTLSLNSQFWLFDTINVKHLIQLLLKNSLQSNLY